MMTISRLCNNFQAMDKVFFNNKEVQSIAVSKQFNDLISVKATIMRCSRKKVIITTSLNKQILYNLLNYNIAVLYAINKVTKSGRYKREFQLSCIGSILPI